VRPRSVLRPAVALAVAAWVAIAATSCLPQRQAQAAVASTASPTAPTATPAPSRGPAAVGRPAPDFALPTAKGQTVRLSDYRGQVVLVNLWATWCPPCRMELPELVAAFNRYRDRGFTILAVNQGEGRDEVQAFAGEYGMAFPVLLDPEGRVLSLYPTRGIPASFLIDRQGVVRQIVIGALDGDQLAQLVEPLLGR